MVLKTALQGILQLCRQSIVSALYLCFSYYFVILIFGLFWFCFVLDFTFVHCVYATNLFSCLPLRHIHAHSTFPVNSPCPCPCPCPVWPLQQQQVGKVVHRLTPLLVLRSLPRLTVAGCVRRCRASLSWAALRWGFFGLSRHVSVCFALLCFIAAAAALHKLVASASFVMQSTWISSVTDLKIIGRRLKTH